MYLTKDHIVPKADGGKDVPSNCQTLCILCNQLKGSKSMTKFKTIMLAYRKLRTEGVLHFMATIKLTLNHTNGSK